MSIPCTFLSPTFLTPIARRDDDSDKNMDNRMVSKCHICHQDVQLVAQCVHCNNKWSVQMVAHCAHCQSTLK